MSFYNLITRRISYAITVVFARCNLQFLWINQFAANFCCNCFHYCTAQLLHCTVTCVLQSVLYILHFDNLKVLNKLVLQDLDCIISILHIQIQDLEINN